MSLSSSRFGSSQMVPIIRRHWLAGVFCFLSFCQDLRALEFSFQDRLCCYQQQLTSKVFTFRSLSGMVAMTSKISSASAGESPSCDCL